MFRHWHLYDLPRCTCSSCKSKPNRLVESAEPCRDVVCTRQQPNVTRANHTSPRNKSTAREGGRGKGRTVSGAQRSRLVTRYYWCCIYLLSDDELKVSWRRNQEHAQLTARLRYHDGRGGQLFIGRAGTSRRPPPYIVAPYLAAVFWCAAPRLLLLVTCWRGWGDFPCRSREALLRYTHRTSFRRDCYFLLCVFSRNSCYSVKHAEPLSGERWLDSTAIGAR